jgi:hypothetical protein
MERAIICATTILTLVGCAPGSSGIPTTGSDGGLFYSDRGALLYPDGQVQVDAWQPPKADSYVAPQTDAAPQPDTYSATDTGSTDTRVVQDSSPAVNPHCSNGQKDPGEMDVDCGGVCPAKCPHGAACTDNKDCQNNSCYQGRCNIDPCKNGQKDAGETDVDCGGSCATQCAHGKACKKDGDCATGKCKGNKCVTCSPSNPVFSGGGCNRSRTHATTDIELAGQGTLTLRCAQYDWFGDNETEYSAKIDLTGATFSGSGCGSFEQLQSFRISGNRITVQCESSWGGGGGSHTITVNGATLSGGCSFGEQAIRLWQSGPTTLSVSCENTWSDSGSTRTRTVKINPVTVCK